MIYNPFEELGLKAGDRVKCETSTETHRYSVGQIFTLVDFCGHPAVMSNSNYLPMGNDPGWMIPMRGYGATWAAA